MKRLVLLLFVLAQLCYSQSVTVKNTYYSTTFDTTKRIPIVVKWWLTKKMLNCSNAVSRIGYEFAPDPKLKVFCFSWERSFLKLN